MEVTQTKNNNKVIIFLIVALCISVGVIVYCFMNQSQQEGAKCEECPVCEKDASNSVIESSVEETIGSYPNLYTTNPTKENIITLFDRYIHVKGLIYEPNLTEIKYDKVTYVGYEGNVRYYEVSGTYTCLSTDVECFYLPQKGVPISGATYEIENVALAVEVTDNDEMYTVKKIDSLVSLGDGFTFVNQEIK